MKLEDEIKQRKFSSEYHKLSLNLLYTAGWLGQQHESFFKAKGLTSAQYNILRILRGQHPQPASINLLRERMLDKMSDASRLVERLRVKGLVTRMESPNDRRMADVFITTKGLALLDSMEIVVKKTESILKNLTKDEAETLNVLLDKMRG